MEERRVTDKDFHIPVDIRHLIIMYGFVNNKALFNRINITVALRSKTY